MSESDATTALTFDPASINKLIAKTENRYHRVLESTTKRVISVNRMNPIILRSVSSTPSNPHPSISHPSIPPPSNNEGGQPTHAAGDSDQSKQFIDNSLPPLSADIDSLAQRLNCLESQVINGLPTTLAHSPNLALPPINLESFDGHDITRWPAYRYQIDMLILNQTHLNEVEKAFYVRSSLKGTAHALVATIPTNKNFLEKIINRLELEYGRRHLTQATLLQSLLIIHSKSDKLVDQIESVRSMISLVHTIDEDCGLDGLVTQLQLAERIHTRFISFIMKRKPAKLLEGLQLIEDSLRTELEEFTITKAISNVHFNHSAIVPSNSTDQSNRPKPSVAGNHPLTPKLPKYPICVYCGQHAYSGECTLVKSINERKEILTNKSLCHICLSDEHSTGDCSKSCYSCKGNHRRSLCE